MPVAVEIAYLAPVRLGDARHLEVGFKLRDVKTRRYVREETTVQLSLFDVASMLTPSETSTFTRAVVGTLLSGDASAVVTARTDSDGYFRAHVACPVADGMWLAALPAFGGPAIHSAPLQLV